MMLRICLVLVAWALLTVVPTAQPASSRSVALTFDDLPGADSRDPGALAATNLAILQALDRHHASATGFVIGERVDTLSNGRDLLQQWIARGHDLGNHTYSHHDLNDQTVQVFTDDLARGEAIVRPLLKQPRSAPLFLRFPFNHTGETAEKHDAVEALLKQRGYDVAVCTIENADYVFATAYARAIAAGGSETAILRTEYLAHTARVIDYFVSLHQTVFGRETAHVMLLHVNRLNADMLDAILETFEQRQFRFVSVRDAQSDPAYRTADTYRTKAGPMWAYRWARSLGVRVDGSLEPEPAPWVSAAAR